MKRLLTATILALLGLTLIYFTGDSEQASADGFGIMSAGVDTCWVPFDTCDPEDCDICIADRIAIDTVYTNDIEEFNSCVQKGEDICIWDPDYPIE